MEEKKHYLLSVTEAGAPVPVGEMNLLILLAGAPKNGTPFQDITGITTTTELGAGILEVTMSSLPSDVDSDTIFQFQVQHDHGSHQHYGTALVAGDSNSTYLGPGQ